MKKIWETGVILFAVLGFWGMIYPDLCFTGDVCAVIYEEEYEDVCRDWKDVCESGGQTDIFTGICKADPSQIRIKSKLLETLKTESKGKCNVINKR